MPNSNQKQHPGADQGNAIENEGGFDDEGRPLHPSEIEPEVSEEDSKLAADHPDGGDPSARRS
jgi:hypothetical protein